MRISLLCRGSRSRAAGAESGASRPATTKPSMTALTALLLLAVSVVPLRAEENVPPEVGEILAELREASNWDWESEHSETEPLAHDHIARVYGELRGRAEAALQALRLAAQEEDVLVRRASVGVASLLWRFDARLDGLRDIPIAALNDRDAIVRREAAYELGQMGVGAAAVSVLIDGLNHADPEMRISAARGLMEVGRNSESAVDALYRHRDDPHATVRRHIVSALGFLGGEREPVVAAMIDAMADPDPGVRISAISALNYRPQHAAVIVPALQEALEDPDRDVRRRAVDVLGSLKEAGGPAAPDVVGRLVDLDEPVGTRQVAATSLRNIWPGAGIHQDLVVEALVAALDDPHGGVRNNAAHALGGIGPAAEAAVPRLIEMMESEPHPSYRGAAGHAIGDIGVASRPAVSTLIEGFWSEEMNVSWGATNGLIGLGPDAVAAAMPTFIEILGTGNAKQRGGVLRAVREFGTVSSAVLEAISQIALDPAHSEDSRADALRSIITIAENTANPDALRRDAFATLIGLAGNVSEPERLRADALRRMNRMADIADTAIPVLRNIYDTDEGIVQSYARGALRAMNAL